MFFFGVNFVMAKNGNDLDEDAPKLGYKLNLKIEILKHPFYKKINLGFIHTWTMQSKSSKIFFKKLVKFRLLKIFQYSSKSKQIIP